MHNMVAITSRNNVTGNGLFREIASYLSLIPPTPKTAGVFMMLFGVLGKFTAFFSTIPDPILGGILFVLFASITSVALTNLENVPIGSSRYYAL